MKLALFTIALIFSSAIAHDFAFRNQHFGRRVGDNADVLAFTKGFLTGVSSSPLFDDIKACIADSTTFYKDVATAIADIKTKNPAKVKEGIALLGKAVQVIPVAAKDCQAAEQDIKRILRLAQAFTNPTSFLYSVGKSLLVNRIEVIHEINSAIQAYDQKNFYNLGYWVGKAMNTIFLGLNQPLRQGNVDFLNANQNSWKAELPEKFAGMTLAEIKAQFLGALPDNEDDITVFEGSANDLPTNFNSSTQWPGCVHAIRDQGHCGSCWAFAASEVLSDRFCIATKSSVNLVLSPQYSVSCDNQNYGCNGGFPILAWNFIVKNGLPTDSCYPYSSYNGTTGQCRGGQCQDGSSWKTYKAKSPVTLTNPQAVQQDIFNYGPAEAAFSVYEDFLSYKGGIYKHVSGSLLGGHAVKIVGWGREESTGTDYWIVHNSWGTSWGENGLFRIAFGQCGFDRAVTSAQANPDAAQAFRWF